MLTAMYITGSCEIQGKTGDVLRMTGSGTARWLSVSGRHEPDSESRAVTFESVITLTGAATYQEIGELSVAGGGFRMPFATIGSGFLINGTGDLAHLGISLCRSAAHIVGTEETTILSTFMSFDLVQRICAITVIVFSAFLGV